MYASVNFRTKKALREAVAQGDMVWVLNVGPTAFWQNPKLADVVGVEGPWYPAPHTWYAVCEVQDGYIISVK